MRDLKMDDTSILRRKKERRDQSNYSKRRQIKDTMAFLPFVQVMDSYIRLPDNTIGQVRDVEASAFRQWFYALVDRFVELSTEQPARSYARSIKQESASMWLDEEARWYLIDKLHAMVWFRRSGIQMFVQPGQEEQAS